MNKTIIILSLVIFILLGIGSGIGYSYYQKHQQNEQFKISMLQMYNNYKVIVDDGNQLTTNIEGRQFSNIFDSLKDLIKRNQDLKMKVADIIPASDDESKKIYDQLKVTVDAHYAYLTSVLSIAEKQQTYQMNKNQDNYKILSEEMTNHLQIAKKSREERQKLQALLSLPVDETIDVDTDLKVSSSQNDTNNRIQALTKNDGIIYNIYINMSIKDAIALLGKPINISKNDNGQEYSFEKGIHLTISDQTNTIKIIVVENPEIASARGVKVGDTLQTVLNVYGQTTPSSYNNFSLYEYLYNENPKQIIRFAVDKNTNKVGYISIRLI